MTARTTLKAMAAALLLLTMAASVRAGDLDDCRSKEQIPNEARMKACSAVIAAGQAGTADLAYAYYQRALTGSANPNADQAVVMADVNKAIELDPKLMEAHVFRALGYSRAMEYDKAIADLSRAIDLAPERWGLYSLRAMVEVQKKDDKAALADYKAALARNPPATSADMIRQRITKLEQGKSQ